MQKNTLSQEMQWKFGVDEYKNLFSKTLEDTSCGPSGLHMSHWKVALQSEELMEVDATLMSAAFSLGMTYQRWNVSYHSMLMKFK